MLQMWGDGKSPANFTGTKSQGPEGSLGLCLPSLEEPLDREFSKRAVRQNHLAGALVKNQYCLAPP